MCYIFLTENISPWDLSIKPFINVYTAYKGFGSVHIFYFLPENEMGYVQNVKAAN